MIKKMKKVITTKNIEDQKHIQFHTIVQVERGEDFQQYRYKKNKKIVNKGISIGYEKNVFGILRLILCKDVEFLSSQ